MKQLKFFAAALLCLFAAACTEEEVSDSLTVVSQEITFPHEGGSTVLSFDASTSWTISADEDWVSFSTTSGNAGTASVTVTVEENESYSSRTAKATIEFGSKTSTISIVQTELTEFSSVVEYTIDASAQNVEVGITANVNYTYEIDSEAQSWISATTTKAEPTTSTLVFSVKANTSISPRSGKVYVSTADAVQCIVITQLAEYNYYETASALYLGNTMLIYDSDTYTYPSYGEYAITLVSEDETSSVVLAVNAEKPDSPLDAIPAGTFEVDATAKHVTGTFSIKPTTRTEKYYTTIYSNGDETLVYDGEINISENGGVYTITAVLLDSGDNEHRFSYEGEIGIEDASYSATATCYYRGTYNTYFASQAIQHSLTLTISRAPDDNTPWCSYLSVILNSESGSEYELPSGTYTYEEPEELGSGNGYVNAQPGTFYSFYANDPDYTYNSDINSGTITVSQNSDGTYNIDLNLNIHFAWGAYDDDWNWVVTDEGDYDYKGSLTDIDMAFDPDYWISSPYPNEDTEFKTIMTGSYQGYWGGNVYREDCNAYIIYLTYVNNVYNIYITISDKDDFEWETNYANRYCNNPAGDGTFTYSLEPKETPNVMVPTTYCRISNSYTGTTSYICGGSVTLDNGYITFNEVKSVNESTGDIYTFTGTVPATVMYWINQSSSTSVFNLRTPQTVD